MIRAGTDIVEVNRVRKIIKLYGNKFLSKIFTKAEIIYCNSQSDPAVHFAGKFSAKESIKKALSENFKISTLKFNKLSILNDYNGRPYLDTNLFQISNLDISISHTKTHAISVAILSNV